MATHAKSANGMGSVTLVGSTYVTTGMKVEDHMNFENNLLNQAGVAQSGDCLVTENGTPNRSVNVAAGSGYILNSAYTDNSTSETRFWSFVNGGTVNVAINTNASGNPRITSIFAKFDTAVTPDGDASNVVTFVAVDGTPAASPVAPATPANHLRLADVTCANGFTSITNANISDQRYIINTRNSLVDNQAWVAFTPSWTNLTVGNGTNTGYYIKIGRTIHFIVAFTLGSTSSVGSTPALTLPVAKASTFTANAPIGITRYNDSGTAIYIGQITAAGNITIYGAAGTYANEAFPSATVPFTWTTGDAIWITGAYQSAS